MSVPIITTGISRKHFLQFDGYACSAHAGCFRNEGDLWRRPTIGYRDKTTRQNYTNIRDLSSFLPNIRYGAKRRSTKLQVGGRKK